MKNDEKKGIAAALKEYVKRYDSQSKAARSLEISAGTISEIINGNWEKISDAMWRNIAAQVGYASAEWVPVETGNYQLMTSLLHDAQNHSNVLAVTGEAGSGKSFTVSTYVKKNKHSYLLSCSEYWNRKIFLVELLTVLGRDYSGYTVAEMMNEAVRELKRQHRPLLILDEADKLSDQVIYFFITLYNQLEDQCGIVMCATDHLEKRINRGLTLNKKGYKEIFSRIGRKFIELDGVNGSDVTSICVNNGVNDKQVIKSIVLECEWDLRRVKRRIHIAKQSAKLSNSN